MDYSFTQLEQAQARLCGGDRDLGGKYLYVAANVYRMPFAPAMFDAATMIRVIHHLKDVPLALCQIQETLQPGATFILEFANKRNLKAIFRYLFGLQHWNPFSIEPIEFVHLNYDFHPAAVRQWLEESGFKIQRLLTVSHLRAGWLKRTVPLELLVWFDSILQRSGEWLQYSPSVFVRATTKERESPLIQSLSTPDEPESLFRCPVCGTYPLDSVMSELICPTCKRRWRMENGIYDFRL
jgi:SAM-dependent methyltransferase